MQIFYFDTPGSTGTIVLLRPVEDYAPGTITATTTTNGDNGEKREQKPFTGMSLSASASPVRDRDEYQSVTMSRIITEALERSNVGSSPPSKSPIPVSIPVAVDETNEMKEVETMDNDQHQPSKRMRVE